MDDSSRSFSTDPPAARTVRTSRWAIASLVAGLGSGLCLCVSGLIGLICGVVALVAIRRSHGQVKGRGLAITGMILSVMLSLGSGAVLTPLIQRETLKSQTAQVRGNSVFQAIQVYADQHGGNMPPDLNTLVAEGLIQSGQLQGPEGEPDFFHLTSPGEKLADQAPTDVIVETAAWKMFNFRPHAQVQANGVVNVKLQ